MTQLDQEQEMTPEDTLPELIATNQITPLTAALRIVQYRAEIKRMEDELVLLAAYLEPYGTQEWDDGEYHYRQGVSRKTTYTIDETKLKFADPELYRNCLVTVVDKSAVREAVNQGRAENAEIYLTEKKGRPYAAAIQREELDSE